MTTIVECVRTDAHEVQLVVPLFKPGTNEREALVTQLKTFRPKFEDVSCFRDGDKQAVVCVATLPKGADRDLVANAQKSFVQVMSEFYPHDEIVLDDRVLH